MRWPLKNRILTRVLLLLLVTISAITFANIRSTVNANRTAEMEQLQRIVELVKSTRFPFTGPVLENMKSLSEAEFALINQDGAVVASTDDAPTGELTESRATRVDTAEPLPELIQSSDQAWYHTRVSRDREVNTGGRSSQLHVFVPRKSDAAVFWQASRSPLLIALFILPLTFLVSLAMANQVTRPLAELEREVRKIADGEIRQIPEGKNNDEIRDLNRTFNNMAVRLRDHEQRLRDHERLRTLVQFGNSVAHHLRNSATGCKMAVQLLAAEHQPIESSENYEVAIRQLGLMDNYIRKFLSASRSVEAVAEQPAPAANLAEIFENVIFLLKPSANHLSVELDVQSDVTDDSFPISSEDAEQLMINLISNAITAASQSANLNPDRDSGRVAVRLTVRDGTLDFRVIDNGDGPPADISNHIMKPFVTGSREGTGLGLSLVKEIADRLQGHVEWRRAGSRTEFVFSAGPRKDAIEQ